MFGTLKTATIRVCLNAFTYLPNALDNTVDDAAAIQHSVSRVWITRYYYVHLFKRRVNRFKTRRRKRIFHCVFPREFTPERCSTRATVRGGRGKRTKDNIISSTLCQRWFSGGLFDVVCGGTVRSVAPPKGEKIVRDVRICIGCSGNIAQYVYKLANKARRLGWGSMIDWRRAAFKSSRLINDFSLIQGIIVDQN